MLRRSPQLRGYSDEQLANLALRGLVVEQSGCLFPTVSGGMAIGTPTQRYQARPTGQTTTTAFSPATTLAAGSMGLLVLVGGSSKIASSVSDNAGGNTYVVDATDITTSQGKSFVSVQVVTPVTNANTITVTWSNGTSSAIAVWLQEITGLATSGAFDKTAANSGSTTSATSGSTGALSQADEIVFAVFRDSIASAWTKGASWSDVTTPHDGTNAALEYQIVAATTALNADSTWTTGGGNWTALSATYRMAAAGVALIPNVNMARQIV